MALSHNQKEFDDMVNGVAKNLTKNMMTGIAKGMDHIGIIATAKHMINPGGEGAAVNEKRLTTRSGRMVRSLLPQGGAFTPKGSREQVRRIRSAGGRIVGWFGSKVPYAAIHEHGGTIKQTVSAKQIAFFWAKWFESDKTADMWKAMAIKFTHLSKTLTIKIKARPVLAPALREGRKEIHKIMSKAVLDKL